MTISESGSKLMPIIFTEVPTGPECVVKPNDRILAEVVTVNVAESELDPSLAVTV